MGPDQFPSCELDMGQNGFEGPSGIRVWGGGGGRIGKVWIGIEPDRYKH